MREEGQQPYPAGEGLGAVCACPTQPNSGLCRFACREQLRMGLSLPCFVHTRHCLYCYLPIRTLPFAELLPCETLVGMKQQGGCSWQPVDPVAGI